MSFELASRYKWRFPSIKGSLTAEQLWELPLQSRTGFDLDTVAKTLNAELKTQSEESFVDESTNVKKPLLEAALALVVNIIGVRKAENAAAATAATKRAERARLTEILHLRTQDDLMKKEPAEIQAMLDALGPA